MNTLNWFKGLIAAIIGGAANSVTVMIVDPETFNLDTGLPKLGAVAAISGVVAAANFLKQSPIPNGK